MASEQAGVRKKQSRHLDRDNLRHQILFRHQDCIPKATLLENCENRSLLKRNQNVECHEKYTKDQESIDSKIKTKLLNTKVKSNNKTDKSLPETKLNPQQPISAVESCEEFSKARKRRLRRRKLLVYQTPAPNTITKPDPPAEFLPHSSSRPISRPSDSASAAIPPTSKPSEQPRPSIKEFRKRLDKSGSRNKNLKSKTLLEPTTLAKADLIKTLEEKRLNSLLQTLVPLANVSPKKEKPLPHFSFLEKGLNTSDTQIDKDGVFYFGETKHQLEKLSSGFKPNTSILQEKSDFAQNKGFDKNSFTANKPANFKYVPSFNFSSLTNGKPNASLTAKKHLFIAESAPQTARIENKRVFPVTPYDYQIKEQVFKSPALNDFSQCPTQVRSSVNPSLSAPVVSFPNVPTFSDTEPKVTLNSVSNQTENNLVMSCDLIASILEVESKYSVNNSLGSDINCSDLKNSSVRFTNDCQQNLINLPEVLRNDCKNKTFVGVISDCEGSGSSGNKNSRDCTNLLLESIKTDHQNNKKMEGFQNNPIGTKQIDTSKPNKTREEIMLEREAKKAAKLASKAKHKINQTNKMDGPNAQLELEKTAVVNNSKKENPEDKNCKIETLPCKCLEDKVHTNTVPSSNKSVSSPNKEAKTDLIDSDSTKIPDSASTKSKSELRAERRAKQEAQRAAKVVNKTDQPQQLKEKVMKKPKVATDQPKAALKSNLTKKKQETVKVSSHPKHKLFGHMFWSSNNSCLTSDLILKVGGLHPAILKLGLQYSTKVVVGSNARCVALLNALKQMISDYTTPLEKEFSRGLEGELKPITDYLNQCRPLSVSMINALRHIKRTLTQLPNNITDVLARGKLCGVIDTYIQDQIDKAGEAICYRVKKKIENGDVILTYGCSYLLYKILVESHLSGTKFRVVIVDGLPWQEGREMLRRLMVKGLSCSYVLVTAVTFIMQKVNKVLLGAHALLANGYVMARAGSSQVALLAKCYNIPVLVCCETHKFCERVQTDAFLYNELVSEVRHDNLSGKDGRRLTPLSLAYDTTPPDYVAAVITELAILPCTSVPVVLRVKPADC